MAEVATLPIDAIRPNESKLREVNTESESFAGLVESIRDTGVINAISVRKKVDPETQEEYYELVDGFHRLTASAHAGLEEINATILDIDAEGDDAELQVLSAQIMANVHKVETKPVEYARQLLRILTLNPMMTEAELAKQVNRSAQWVRQQMKLTRIKDPNICKLVDEGKIAVIKAYALSTLPPEEQAALVDAAMVEDVKAFTQTVEARKKEIKEANKAGRETKAPEFQPRARLRSLKDLDSTRQDEGKIQQLIVEADASTVTDGFLLALDYMRHMDPITLQKEKADWEEKQRIKEEKKIAKQQAAAKKKAEAAAKKAEELHQAAAEIGAQAEVDAENANS